MATILLSIKPEYANRIFDGSKKYEFRKHLPQKKIDKIVVYSTDPVQRVIGEVEVTPADHLDLGALLWYDVSHQRRWRHAKYH